MYVYLVKFIVAPQIYSLICIILPLKVLVQKISQNLMQEITILKVFASQITSNMTQLKLKYFINIHSIYSAFC